MLQYLDSKKLPICLGCAGFFYLMSGTLFGLVCMGLALYVSFASFPKADQADVDSVLQAHKLQLVAHRGAALDFPENTLAAFRKAKEHGADAVEFDLEFTSDGQAVILHDDTVDRTTNGTGAISQLSFQQSQALCASSKHPRASQFPNEKIPTLEDTVALCLQLDLRMYIDVKSSPDKSAEVLSALYQRYPTLYSRAIVCSFNPIVIYKVRKADPRIVTGLTWRPWFISASDIDGPWREGPVYMRPLNYVADVILRWAHFNWLHYLINNSAFLLHRHVVSQDMVKYFGERGVQIVVWTVNDSTEKAFLQQNLKVPVMTDTLKN